ncbi:MULTISPECIES: DUF962 domain-containing protein [Amniculibacterium]|jgi:uncharacterized membrane protein YGL010W|uniref:Mpo1 family 2-hydroxy fatty acid dioxygenase n=1 Tax=Amniculibacterium TaxID=2715289 RepID=UPI000F5B1B7B|nr:MULTISPECIES: Mpo1-like protein [Amniculibacterium]
MRKIDILFSEYGKSHKNKINKAIHWVCVPLIFWSILGFISLIPTPHIFIQFMGYISVASLVSVLLVSIYYLLLNWKMAIIMFFVMMVFEKFVYETNIFFERKSWLIFVSVFVITWIFQFVGHKIEGKKPSFLKDIQFLLIGPIWLIKKILPFRI